MNRLTFNVIIAGYTTNIILGMFFTGLSIIVIGILTMKVSKGLQESWYPKPIELDSNNKR